MSVSRQIAASDVAAIAPLRNLASSAAPVSHTGDTLEFTLATITLPGNTLGANGRVIITTLWSYTNSANNKTQRVKFGGTTFLARAETTTASSRVQTMVANRAATNSQVGTASNVGSGGWGSSTGALITSAVDTTADVTILITGQLALGSETITLEAYTVEIEPLA